MIAVAAPSLYRLTRRHALLLARFGAVVGAVVARASQTHPGLLYPDGYQYFLMARAAESGAGSTMRLGVRGDIFVPSADAAAKPLYPALLALGHLFGLGWRHAATILVVAAAAAVVVLCGELVWTLTRSATGALAAAGLCLVSPALGFWSGFAGPDPVAEAFGLGACLCGLRRRPVAAGLLAAAAVATRPELALLAVSAGAACAFTSGGRRSLARAVPAGLALLAAVLLIMRPVIGAPPLRLIGAGVVLAALLVAALRVPRSVTPALVVGVLVLLGWTDGGRALLRSDAPLVAAALLGIILAARRTDLRPALHPVAKALALSVLALGVLYALKNPESERYPALLVPLLAVLAGLGLATLNLSTIRARAAQVLLAAAVVAAALATAPTPIDVGPDSFALLAPDLAQSAQPLLTAAPDAYGFLLPHRSVRALRLGEHGLIVLDGAQRQYAPDLSARGRLIETLTQVVFVRPNGTQDRGIVRVVLGTVVRRASQGSFTG
jgi:hypothetical protein